MGKAELLMAGVADKVILLARMEKAPEAVAEAVAEAQAAAANTEETADPELFMYAGGNS